MQVSSRFSRCPYGPGNVTIDRISPPHAANGCSGPVSCPCRRLPRNATLPPYRSAFEQRSTKILIAFGARDSANLTAKAALTQLQIPRIRHNRFADRAASNSFCEEQSIWAKMLYAPPDMAESRSIRSQRPAPRRLPVRTGLRSLPSILVPQNQETGATRGRGR